MNKVNVIYYNSTLLKGGTDKYMVEVVKNINKEEFHVDVLIKDGEVLDEDLLNELKANGANIFVAKGSTIKKLMYIRKFFKTHKNQYDVAHINATSQATGIISYFAKKNGKIKNVIFHSHMGGNDHAKSMFDKIGNKLLLKYSDFFASCSTEASKYMFGKLENVQVLNNAVDTQKFGYDVAVREKIRSEIGVTETTKVFLHVGRFAPQKNHKQLIKIFNAYLAKDNNAKLLLIGNGNLLEETKELILDLKISDKVSLLGLKNNINEYMQAADCFLMPSVHEGLPIVAVEAQSTGLPCLLSTNISQETKLIDNVYFIDNFDIDKWTNEMLNIDMSLRTAQGETLKEKGFDKSSAIKKIEQIYTQKQN